MIDWWRDAVVYQIYIRSFADGNGDGLGDIAGIRARLPYLAALGVDAIWINPWYPSPMADGGYDVSDYRDVDPRFGTLAEAENLIAEGGAGGPGAPARARSLSRPGRGTDGAAPPNDWSSVFGGPAWTRVTEPDGTPGEWYLHLFAPEQPDLNWNSADV